MINIVKAKIEVNKLITEVENIIKAIDQTDNQQILKQYDYKLTLLNNTLESIKKDLKKELKKDI